MRNRFSVLDLSGRFAALLGGRSLQSGQELGQSLMITATVMALLCAGPLALRDLVLGQPAAFAIVATIAGVAGSSVLIRQAGQVFASILSLQTGLVLGALSVAVGTSDGALAGVSIATAAALYGVLQGERSKRVLLSWPILAAILAIALSWQPGPSAWTTGYALIGACASLLACVAMALVHGTERRKPDDRMILALESLVGAIVRYDHSGKPLHISGAAAGLFNVQAYELTGSGLLEKIHVQDRPHYAKAISDLLSKGGRTGLELRVRAGGNTAAYKWVELSIATTERFDGSDAAIGIFRDISAQKAVENDLRNARAEAEEASDAKTRFLATIGHELRTPLNAIVGFSDMMAEGIGGALSPTHQDYAGHIRQSGHHLLEVVNMLLDMSKIDAGKFELQAEPFAPQGLVDPCLQMVENLARERNVTVVGRIPEQLPHIMGDERACRQIMINLLSNAIKFSHDDGEVVLAMKRHGKMLSISVSDNGIGMPAETIRRIGEPFLQAQNGLARRYEGTGLGLSIVKGLVSLHNGRMNVASEPGVGTRVTVLLPIDGPSPSRAMTTIEHLDSHRRDTDEDKWQNDEKRSAMS